MASKRGMALRMDAAQERLTDARNDLETTLGIQLPEPPAPQIDKRLDAVLRTEWLGGVYEQVTAAAAALAD